MKELLYSVPTILACIFWIGSVAVFSTSIYKNRKEMWSMVIGDDNKMQKSEAVLYYWLFMFPFSVFCIFLLAILGINIDEKNISLIKWVLGCLELILVSILGHDVLKKNNEK